MATTGSSLDKHITTAIENKITNFINDLPGATINSKSDLSALIEEVMDQIYSQLLKALNAKITAENNFLNEFLFDGTTSTTGKKTTIINDNGVEVAIDVEPQHGYSGLNERTFIRNQLNTYNTNVSKISDHLK